VNIGVVASKKYDLRRLPTHSHFVSKCRSGGQQTHGPDINIVLRRLVASSNSSTAALDKVFQGPPRPQLADSGGTLSENSRPQPTVHGCQLFGNGICSRSRVAGSEVFLHEHTQWVVRVTTKRSPALIAG
jgi:hypothetical protein